MQPPRRTFLRRLAALGFVGVVGSASAGTVSADPGDERWRYEVEDFFSSVRGGPTIVDGVVYCAIRGQGSEYLVALDADGEERWQFEIETGGVIAAPQVIDGRIYLPDLVQRIYGIDTAGEEDWRTSFGGSESSATLANDVVYVGGDDVLALEPDTGDEVWSTPVTGTADGAPTIVDGTVYITAREVIALDAENGDEVWTFEPDGSLHASATVTDGMVIVGDDEGVVYGIEDGDESWRYEADAGVRTTPTVAGGLVYVGSDRGSLYALDAGSGDLEWDAELASGIESSPTVAGDVVYAGSDDGFLHAVDADSGDELWAFEAADRIRSDPTVVDGVVYVGDDEGYLYAIEGESGSSEGSRVSLGTLGHHDSWTGDPEAATGGDDDSIPGLGLLGALGGLGGATYLLKRRIGASSGY